MLGRARVFSSVRRKEESKNERERERVMQIDRESEREEKERDKKNNKCDQRQGFVSNWLGWLGWVAGVAPLARWPGCVPPQESSTPLPPPPLPPHIPPTHPPIHPPTPTHTFSTTRVCLREREEREYAGAGGGGEGSHPHGTPSFQVEVFGVGQDFGLRFSVRVCDFLLCLCFGRPGAATGAQQESEPIAAGPLSAPSSAVSTLTTTTHPPTLPWLDVVWFWVSRPSPPPSLKKHWLIVSVLVCIPEGSVRALVPCQLGTELETHTLKTES